MRMLLFMLPFVLLTACERDDPVKRCQREFGTQGQSVVTMTLESVNIACAEAGLLPRHPTVVVGRPKAIRSAFPCRSPALRSVKTQRNWAAVAAGNSDQAR